MAGGDIWPAEVIIDRGFSLELRHRWDVNVGTLLRVSLHLYNDESAVSSRFGWPDRNDEIDDPDSVLY